MSKVIYLGAIKKIVQFDCLLFVVFCLFSVCALGRPRHSSAPSIT